MNIFLNVQVLKAVVAAKKQLLALWSMSEVPLYLSYRRMPVFRLLCGTQWRSIVVTSIVDVTTATLPRRTGALPDCVSSPT